MVPVHLGGGVGGLGGGVGCLGVADAGVAGVGVGAFVMEGFEGDFAINLFPCGVGTVWR